MTHRFLYDSIGEYRARTKEMPRPPGDTFICGKCGGYRAISGRKIMSRDGNRVKYVCLRCQKEAT